MLKKAKLKLLIFVSLAGLILAGFSNGIMSCEKKDEAELENEMEMEAFALHIPLHICHKKSERKYSALVAEEQAEEAQLRLQHEELIKYLSAFEAGKAVRKCVIEKQKERIKQLEEAQRVYAGVGQFQEEIDLRTRRLMTRQIELVQFTRTQESKTDSSALENFQQFVRHAPFNYD